MTMESKMKSKTLSARDKIRYDVTMSPMEIVDYYLKSSAMSMFYQYKAINGKKAWSYPKFYKILLSNWVLPLSVSLLEVKLVDNMIAAHKKHVKLHGENAIKYDNFRSRIVENGQTVKEAIKKPKITDRGYKGLWDAYEGDKCTYSAFYGRYIGSKCPFEEAIKPGKKKPVYKVDPNSRHQRWKNYPDKKCTFTKYLERLEQGKPFEEAILPGKMGRGGRGRRRTNR